MGQVEEGEEGGTMVACASSSWLVSHNLNRGCARQTSILDPLTGRQPARHSRDHVLSGQEALFHRGFFFR
jgi:hypothetical protein